MNLLFCRSNFVSHFVNFLFLSSKYCVKMKSIQLTKVCLVFTLFYTSKTKKKKIKRMTFASEIFNVFALWILMEFQ